jgi:hypothetical protein
VSCENLKTHGTDFMTMHLDKHGYEYELLFTSHLLVVPSGGQTGEATAEQHRWLHPPLLHDCCSARCYCWAGCAQAGQSPLPCTHTCCQCLPPHLQPLYCHLLH